MSGARILIIEDDGVLRNLLQRNLEVRKHSVSVASDARMALYALRNHVFDLVILDIHLPDQTGWEVLRVAQREGWLTHRQIEVGKTCLPVVIVSAVRVSLERLKDFSPLAYLPKPFPLEALLRLADEAAQRCQPPHAETRTRDEFSYL